MHRGVASDSSRPQRVVAGGGLRLVSLYSPTQQRTPVFAASEVANLTRFIRLSSHIHKEAGWLAVPFELKRLGLASSLGVE